MPQDGNKALLRVLKDELERLYGFGVIICQYDFI